MQSLINSVEKAWPPELWTDLHVVVAVSGGPDSMARLRAVLEMKGRYGGRGEVFAAHVHHGLHAAAEDDVEWLAAQMDKLRVPLTVERVNVRALADQEGDGLEAAARSLRYTALQATAEQLGARYVATGHTADDQVETVLHRILRGTGIEGLAGIPRQRPLGEATTLVRPLLDTTRDQVADYLQELEQPYRLDPTNGEIKFTRNRIRHDLLPQLRREFNPKVDESVLRLARQAEELISVLKPQVAALLEEAVHTSGQEFQLDAARLRQEPEPLAREVIRSAWRRMGWPEQEMSEPVWRKLSDLLDVHSARVALPRGVEVEVGDDVVRFFRG